MTRLYLITPSHFQLSAFAGQLEDALSGGDVGCVQLRMKHEDSTVIPAEAGIQRGVSTPQTAFLRGLDASLRWHDSVREAAKILMPLCHARNIPFIINDYPEIARDVGADGVHLGDEDVGVAEARKIVGAGKIIGVSCYASRDRAFTAGEEGADYVAFGQFYETKTKPAKGHPTPEILEFWSKYTTIPCVAIGGITPENCAPLVKAGADFIAVVTGVWEHPKGARAAVAEYNAAITAAQKDQEPPRP